MSRVREPSRAAWLRGMGLVVVVALIWIAASYLVQAVEDQGLTPFVLTYICNSLFMLYIPLVELSWWRTRGGRLSSALLGAPAEGRRWVQGCSDTLQGYSDAVRRLAYRALGYERGQSGAPPLGPGRGAEAGGVEEGEIAAFKGEGQFSYNLERAPDQELVEDPSGHGIVVRQRSAGDPKGRPGTPPRAPAGQAHVLNNKGEEGEAEEEGKGKVEGEGATRGVPGAVHRVAEQEVARGAQESNSISNSSSTSTGIAGRSPSRHPQQEDLQSPPETPHHRPFSTSAPASAPALPSLPLPIPLHTSPTPGLPGPALGTPGAGTGQTEPLLAGAGPDSSEASPDDVSRFPSFRSWVPAAVPWGRPQWSPQEGGGGGGGRASEGRAAGGGERGAVADSMSRLPSFAAWVAPFQRGTDGAPPSSRPGSEPPGSGEGAADTGAEGGVPERGLGGPIPGPEGDVMGAGGGGGGGGKGWTRARIAGVSLLICPFWFLAQLTFNVSLDYTTVSSNTILSSTSSLFTLLVSVAFLGERFTLNKIASVLLVILGTAVVSLADRAAPPPPFLTPPTTPTPGPLGYAPGFGAAGDSGQEVGAHSLGAGDSLVGDLLCLCSAFFYAVYTSLLRKCAPEEGEGEWEVQGEEAASLGPHGAEALVCHGPAGDKGVAEGASAPVVHQAPASGSVGSTEGDEGVHTLHADATEDGPSQGREAPAAELPAPAPAGGTAVSRLPDGGSLEGATKGGPSEAGMNGRGPAGGEAQEGEEGEGQGLAERISSDRPLLGEHPSSQGLRGAPSGTPGLLPLPAPGTANVAANGAGAERDFGRTSEARGKHGGGGGFGASERPEGISGTRTGVTVISVPEGGVGGRERQCLPLACRAPVPYSTALMFGYLGCFNMLLLLPLLLLLPIQLHWPTPPQWGLVITKGLLDNVLSDYLWAIAVLLTTPTAATAGLQIQIPISIAVDSLATGTPPDLLHLLGAALVLLGFFGINAMIDFERGLRALGPLRRLLWPADPGPEEESGLVRHAEA